MLSRSGPTLPTKAISVPSSDHLNGNEPRRSMDLVLIVYPYTALQRLR